MSVKLVAEVGVGTVAAGVAKANADHVVIAGHDGGTGASPLSSISRAGVPWEIGLAETQQTLLRTTCARASSCRPTASSRPAATSSIAAMLGADEFGFSTAPLIATGCIMMRACHLNTCPVGIATQDPELRKRFQGKPEHVVNFFFFVAEEVRGIMASLGVRTFDELIGRVDLLSADEAIEHWKARGVDLTHLLHAPARRARRRAAPPHRSRRRRCSTTRWTTSCIEQARAAIERGEPTCASSGACATSTAASAACSRAEIAELHGAEGLPDGHDRGRTSRGSAGQSFGGWLAPGVTFTLHGDANDYTGKGLSGGVLAVRPPDGVTFAAEENVIIGNTVLYGATGGQRVLPRAGRRALRRAQLGRERRRRGRRRPRLRVHDRRARRRARRTGRNFAAGMSGGIAYVLDEDGALRARASTRRCSTSSRRSTTATPSSAATLVAEHARADRLAGRRSACSTTGTRCCRGS